MKMKMPYTMVRPAAIEALQKLLTMQRTHPKLNDDPVIRALMTDLVKRSMK